MPFTPPPSRIGPGESTTGTLLHAERRIESLTPTHRGLVMAGMVDEEEDLKQGEAGTNPQKGTYRDRDLSWTDKKKTLIWALQMCEAYDVASAVATNDLWIFVNTLNDPEWYMQWVREQEKRSAKSKKPVPTANQFGRMALKMVDRFGYIRPPFLEGMVTKWVRHYMFHAASDPKSPYTPPGEGGYTVVSDLGGGSYTYHLTTKGRMVDVFSKEVVRTRFKTDE